MELLIIIIVVILIIKNIPIPKPQFEFDRQTNDITENTNYMPYVRKNLLTPTEQFFYSILYREAQDRNLIVCPKVRLEDIVQVTDKQNINKYRGYIKSRHIDFVLLNFNCETVAAIELDDPSHNTRKAYAADNFKNELFYTTGIPLIRIYTGVNYTRELNEAFDELQIPKINQESTEQI